MKNAPIAIHVINVKMVMFSREQIFMSVLKKDLYRVINNFILMIQELLTILAAYIILYLIVMNVQMEILATNVLKVMYSSEIIIMNVYQKHR